MSTTCKHTFRTLRLCIAAVAFGAIFHACEPIEEPIAQHDRPTWAVADTTDLESTMTITGVLPAALAGNAGTADIVAAFAGNDCWGLTNIRYVNDQAYFFLFVNRPRSNADSFPLLTLRYYSTKTRYIYVEKEVCTFAVDAMIGTIDTPFTPKFTTTE